MKKKEEITPVKRFWLLLKPNKREIRQVYAFAILNGLVALSLPLGIQSIINLIQGGQVSTVNSAQTDPTFSLDTDPSFWSTIFS